mmetsp:Transcript_31456/g.91988  ORF Transcript_31456/g.91988 Transcript_31456/m.91988 type:complete len:219 (-) Transcript_31456:91-747(-)
MQFLTAKIRTESCSSFASFSKACRSPSSMESWSRTSATEPNTFAAWRRTIGASSLQRRKYIFRRSSFFASPTLCRAAAKRLHTEIRDVYQSWDASLAMREQKCRVTCSVDISSTRLFNASVALSLTDISSTLQSSSNGPVKECAYGGPPTQDTPCWSCPAKAMRTSSSSSMISWRKGRSSSRVRSWPRAVAMVPRFLMEFSRNCMSSCLSSSINTATG